MKTVELCKNDGRKTTILTEYTGQKLHEISKKVGFSFHISFWPQDDSFNIATPTRSYVFFPELQSNFLIVYEYTSVWGLCSCRDFNVYK